MRHLSSISLAAFLVAVGTALAPGSASAWVKWHVGSGGYCYNQGSGYGNKRTCDSDTYGVGDVTASAWANTMSSNNTALDEARLNVYGGGLGITHGDGETGHSPQHAIDNDSRFELVLFDFGGEEVRLEEIFVGWIGPWNSGSDSGGFGNYEDADISVLAYKPDDANRDNPTAALGGTVYNLNNEGLTANGWELLGNTGTVASTNVDDTQWLDLDNDGTQGSNDVSSSYWLVGAYNPVFGGCAACDWGAGAYDFFKLQKLKGKIVEPPSDPPTSVPAPPSLLLLALGMVPAVLRRRQRARKAAA